MKITPIEIRQKDFNKVFRGYEKEEVDAFLKSLSLEWEKMQDENREITKRLELSEKEVSRLREVESSLFKTIKNAEDTGANLIEHAQRQSDLHMREAQINAEAIMSEARKRARITIEEAEMEAKTLVGNLLDEVADIQKEFKEIEFKKQHVLQEIQALGEGLLERVQRENAKPNRIESEQRIEKVIRAAQSINTEIDKNMPEQQLKTSVTPISPIKEKTEETLNLFAKETTPLTKEIKKEENKKAEQTKSAKAIEEEKESIKTLPPSESKDSNSGSFFDSI
jgi:cell division initiation protein